MATFLPAFQKTVRHEGGYSDDPDDPGGETNYGISKAAHPDAWRNGPPSKDEAIRVYRESYWDRLGLGEIEDQAVAEKIFDLAVNVGPVGGVGNDQDLGAGEAVQLALNRLGHKVKVDGVIGPRTRGAINRARSDDLLRELIIEQAIHYRRWIGRDPDRQKFHRGLVRRAFFHARDYWGARSR